MSIMIHKNLDKNDYIDYVFKCNMWTEDPRYNSRNIMIGETSGLFRINKKTLEPELLIAMENDENNFRYFRAQSTIINEYKLTNTFPEIAHFASG